MRTEVPKELELARIRKGPLASDESYGLQGYFTLYVGQHPAGFDTIYCIQSSNRHGWDHVSCYAIYFDYENNKRARIMGWMEMEYIRSLFFEDDEWVIQYSPPREKRVNVHPYVLHMWRPHDGELATPPQWMVG